MKLVGQLVSYIPICASLLYTLFVHTRLSFLEFLNYALRVIIDAVPSAAGMFIHF
jgi:hypothetical protein